MSEKKIQINTIIASISIDKENNLFGVTFKEHICCNWCKRLVPESTIYYKLTEALEKYYEGYIKNKKYD